MPSSSRWRWTRGSAPQAPAHRTLRRAVGNQWTRAAWRLRLEGEPTFCWPGTDVRPGGGRELSAPRRASESPPEHAGSRAGPRAAIQRVCAGCCTASKVWVGVMMPKTLCRRACAIIARSNSSNSGMLVPGSGLSSGPAAVGARLDEPGFRGVDRRHEHDTRRSRVGRVSV